MKRKFTLRFVVLFALMVFLSAFAYAADPVPISTADELKAILDSGSEVGITYVLENDIEIDTSAWTASYNAVAPSRQFKGILDGQGHTITVLDAGGTPSRPLIDLLSSGNSTQLAKVQNLNVVYQGDVAGTTIAATLAYGEIDKVNISFEKDILFADTADGHTIATGVCGVRYAWAARISNVTVKATGAAPYGIIGSQTPMDKPTLLAGGIYTDTNFAGASTVCDHVSVEVNGIYATTASTAEGAACTAAGAVPGYYQTTANLGYVDVTVHGSIAASAANGATADVDAYGLGFRLLSMYNCSVEVDGDIAVSGNSSASRPYCTPVAPEYKFVAAGFGFVVSTKYNNTFFGSDDTGECSVTVHGDISVHNSGDDHYPEEVIAAGVSAYATYDATWKDISVSAERITAETDGSGQYAKAVGLNDNASYGTPTSDPYHLVDCTVTAKEISAKAPGGAYATGGVTYLHVSAKGCEVEVDRIHSESKEEAISSGFVYKSRMELENGPVEIKDCRVSANEITANATTESGYSYAAGLACWNYLHQVTITGCSVDITDKLMASGGDAETGLLVVDNENSYRLIDNTVSLPKSTVAFETVDDSTYVRFTYHEKNGQAAQEDWESGNQVILLAPGEIETWSDLDCAFDDGSVHGTLWGGTKTVNKLPRTVSFDSQGGSAVDSQTVPYNTKAAEPTAPTRSGYTFGGWYTDPGCTNAFDFETAVTEDVTLYAKWDVSTYSLCYESNGGTSYQTEYYEYGAPVPLTKVPTRVGYTFTGWYADEALTQKITEIQMNGSQTVYAGWKASTVPDMLNGEDHFAYIIGYSDGTVRPNENISRAETATIFFRLLKAEVRDGNLTSTNSFDDVNDGMWYNKAVSTLAKLGILKGRTDQQFDPGAPITRAEFAAICARFDSRLTDTGSEFTDISGHWAETEIARAASLGWIEGYTDDTFRPNKYITRAEAMTMINRVLCRKPETEDDLLTGMRVWPDNQPGEWYYLAVQESTNSHDYTHKGEIYESWVKRNDDPDWTRYQD